MGLFKSIKKGFKKVFKGIGKVFKGAMKVIGKVAGSKWGKMLMLAAAVFTGGMALAGGIAGWSSAASQGAGFMGKFVAGAKGFVASLANPIQQAKSMAGGVEAAGGTAEVLAAGQQAAGGIAGEVGQSVAGAATTAETAAVQGTQVLGAGGQGAIADVGAAVGTGAGGGGGGVLSQAAKTAAGAMQGPPGTLANAGVAGSTQAAAPGWLSKAATFAKDFAMSPAGGQMLVGLAKGNEQEEEYEFRDRVRKRWMDPNNELAQMNREGGPGVNVDFGGQPSGLDPRSNIFSPEFTRGPTPAGSVPIG